MILGPILLLDCAVLCIFLVPQMILQAGILTTTSTIIKSLPFLLFRLPLQIARERYSTPYNERLEFVQQSTGFEDLVIRCVRHAFKEWPSSVARVFFSKQCAVPLLRWRMLRHGFLRYPLHMEECTYGDKGTATRGTWMRHSLNDDPDIVIYYVHGGGFALGSTYFYLEFLLAWHHLLLEAGFKNPAIFALEYTLAPDEMYPTQVLETLQGYKNVLDVAKDASKVCLAGDSAGGCLVLSLLLELSSHSGNLQRRSDTSQMGTADLEPRADVPRLATLISPWITLVSTIHKDSEVDYLDRYTLWRYAHRYAGSAMVQKSPASPGCCTDSTLWKRARPSGGYFLIYGENEVFAQDIENFAEFQSRCGVKIESLKIQAGVHAWPVASLFLSSTPDRRLHGLKSIVNHISHKFRNKYD